MDKIMDRLPVRKDKGWWILGLKVSLLAFLAVLVGLFLGGNYQEGGRFFAVSLPFFTITFFMGFFGTLAGYFGGRILALLAYVGLVVAAVMMAILLVPDHGGWELLSATMVGILVYGVNFLFGLLFQGISWLSKRAREQKEREEE